MILLMTSCAPVFSELQSARTVGKNRFEVTPSFSTVGFAEEGESEAIQNHVGFQAAYGLNPKIDLRVRYEYAWLKDDNEGSASVIGFGPKFGLLRDKIAFAIPIGTAFGKDIEDAWEIHPTLLLTYPIVKDKIDITVSPKYLMTLSKETEDFVAVNFGLSISSDLNKWAIRPEYGLLYNPGETGHFTHFSIGVSAVIGK